MSLYLVMFYNYHLCNVGYSIQLLNYLFIKFLDGMQYIKYICCVNTYNLCLYFFGGMTARKNHSTSKHFPQSLTTQQLLLTLGADPGFDVRGDEIRQGGLGTA